MDLQCDERQSDSTFVETIWRSGDDQAGPFISMAETQFSMVVTKYAGRTFLTVRGPATYASPAYSPPAAEFLGIQFKPGVFMPNLPATLLMDRHDVNLPEAASKSFWLNSSVWEYPDFDNADTFVARLKRDGLLAYDPLVGAVLRREPVEMSMRTLRRRFLRATGLTHGSLYQIDRARYATSLLKQGASILDTVYEAGYFDQPHLTRSLKRLIGLTPSQIADRGRTERLSLLYKTTSPTFATLSLHNNAYENTVSPQAAP